jgi:CubicO group peptidase (beta-lactamase class C family)
MGSSRLPFTPAADTLSAMPSHLSVCRPSLLVVLGLAAAPVSAQQTAGPPPGFDGYVAQVLKAFTVPGVAVAIVKDGRVVLAKGYGVRRLGEPTPVDGRTQFGIASNTKLFTASSLAMLVEAGKLEWDAPVIRYLPWFAMYDPFVTRELTVRDLLVHRSGLGLGAGDLLYWPTTDYSNEEVARRLRDVPLTGSFRNQYAYDNILFGVAQLVVEQASRQSYREFLQSRIFMPLDMAETRYNSDHLKPGDKVATGHAKAGFTELQAVPRMTWSNVAGAGGIYSSVHDMGKWMRLQLDGGVISGEGEQAKRLFSAKRQQEMWSMITPIPIPAPPVPQLAAASPDFLGYGEGWNLSDYRGRKLVWHTGGWPGMVSRVTLVPGQKLGIVVLTNQEVGAAFHAITLRALDAYADAPKSDWIAAYAAGMARKQGEADDSWRKHVAARDARSKPSLPLAKYAGTYRDPWYGDVAVAEQRGKLVLRFSHTAQLVGDLEHWQHDTFIVRWRDRGLNADAFVDFDLDVDGMIREIRMKPVSPLTDFSFDFQDLRLVPVKDQ